MKHSLLWTAGAAMAALALPGNASAATYIVDAQAHSISGGSGTGLDTGLVFSMGDALKISSFVQDLWSAGALPRYSNADGLTGDRHANAADDSGEAPGTLIGTDFGLLDISGFSAPYGALVGQYADGTFQLFGSHFNGSAAGTGNLTLYYWDSNSGDNFGDISFDVIAGAAGAVPEPATWAMMILGMGAVGGSMRRRTRAQGRLRVSYG